MIYKHLQLILSILFCFSVSSYAETTDNSQGEQAVGLTFEQQFNQVNGSIGSLIGPAQNGLYVQEAKAQSLIACVNSIRNYAPQNLERIFQTYQHTNADHELLIRRTLSDSSKSHAELLAFLNRVPAETAQYWSHFKSNCRYNSMGSVLSPDMNGLYVQELAARNLAACLGTLRGYSQSSVDNILRLYPHQNIDHELLIRRQFDGNSTASREDIIQTLLRVPNEMQILYREAQVVCDRAL